MKLIPTYQDCFPVHKGRQALRVLSFPRWREVV